MFILILYIYAGFLAKGDSVAITSVPGFETEKACVDAGNKGRPLVDASSKEYRFICVKKN